MKNALCLDNRRIVTRADYNDSPLFGLITLGALSPLFVYITAAARARRG